MRERIRELAEGKVEYRKPVFTVCPDTIDISLDVNGIHHTVVMLTAEGNQPVKGVAYSSHSRVVVQSPTFFGRTCSISLEINTMGLTAVSRIDGDLTLVTNAGEQKVHFLFSMVEKNFGHEDRVIEEIDDFADYVHENSQGALKLFRSRSFLELPFMKNMNSMALYQILMAESDGRRNMEAFLTYHGAKEPVKWHLKEKSLTCVEPAEPVKKTVEICQDTWGYGVLTVTADNEFVALAKEKLTSDDFDEQGCCQVGYTLFPGNLRTGKKTVEIVFHSAREEMVYTLKLQPNEEAEGTVAGQSEKRKHIRLMNLITDYRAKEICSGGKNTSRVKKSLQTLIEYLKDETEKNPEDWEKKLLLIYFYMKNDQPEMVDAYLDEVREEVMRNRLVHVRAYCFFLYLRAVFYKSEEQLDTASKLIGKYYNENGQDPALMLLLLRTDASYLNNESLRMIKLKEMYNSGCTSPLLYLETCDAYRRSPNLLRMLNEFERQAMLYGARKGLLSEDLAVEVAHLCAYEDHFTPATYQLLTNMFEAYPIQIVLENLCGYLIRTGRKQEKYFRWFEMGIKSGVALVGINEAYIEALPKKWNKPLPKEILLYFAYSQDLRGDVRELLYENILLYQEETSQIYAEYKEQMEEYALSQLLDGRFSRKLLPLYRRLISGEMIDERLARVLPELLMTYEITCHHKDMRKVIIRCPELNYEDTYPLVDGQCCAPLYTDDCLVFFVDRFGNRFSDVVFEKEILFDDETLLERCEKKYPDYLIFLLRRCKQLLDRPMTDLSEQIMMDKVMNSAEVSEFFKNRLVSRLLDFAMTEGQSMSDNVLMSLDLRQLTSTERRKALECMVKNRHYSDVYEYISRYSVNGLEPDTLLLLAEQRMQRIKGAEEEFLLSLCKYLFDKGEVSVQIQAYLCKYYNGPCDQMRRILFECPAENIILADLPERTLGQMLFSDDSTDIERVFDLYRRSPRVNTQLVRAYQIFECYRYFVLGEKPDDSIFLDMVHTLFNEEANDVVRKALEAVDIAAIALLYYLTKNEDIVPDQLAICETLLGRLTHKGLFFGFYTLLWEKVSFPAELNGKVLLEHRSRGVSRAFCTYRRLDRSEAVTVQMQKMYEGIFVAQVVLFADETLEYSIREEVDGEMRVAVEKELLSNDMSFVRDGSSFERINEFSRLHAAGQEKQLEDALLEYEESRHVINSLFLPV